MALLSLTLLSRVFASSSRAAPLRASALRASRAACTTLSASSDEAVAALSYDLETTGLDTETNEIIQLAVVCANSRRNAEFSRLVYPDGEIDPGASGVHGWTKPKLREHGAVPFSEAWADCEGWLASTFNDTRPLVWAAHNGKRFDRPILERCVRQATGTASAAFSGPRATHVDTLQLARAALPGRSGRGSYTLARLHGDAGKGSIEDAHDALVDARALARVWQWLVVADADAADARKQQQTFQQYLQRLGYSPTAEPIPLPRRAGSARAVTTTTRSGAAPLRSPLSDDASVFEFPGVGAKLAARLEGRGICCVADLKQLWRDHGSDKKKLGFFLHKSMPGMPKITFLKLAKELELAMEKGA